MQYMMTYIMRWLLFGRFDFHSSFGPPGCPWLPQAPKCNSYIMTYIMKLLLFGGSDFLGFPWPPWLPLGPWLPQAQKCNSYIMTYIMKLLLFGGSDFHGCPWPSWAPWLLLAAPDWPSLDDSRVCGLEVRTALILDAHQSRS